MIDLPLNRKLTKQFIDQLPTSVVLTPNQRVRTPAGGYVLQPQTARPPQVMTLIEQGGTGGLPRPIVTTDGVERVVEFELLGEHDAQMAVGDTFAHQGKDWELVGIFYENGYERRALVAARG